MAFETDKRFELRTGQTAAQAVPIDEGLRAYMLQVYNYMASGLALTGIVALAVASSEAAMGMIFGTGLSWIVMLSPLAFVMVLSFGVNKMKASTLQAVFWGFSAVMGLSMASIFIMYTGTSIARVFFITAGTFAAMSLYGYTTKKDLTGWGSFLFRGLIGVVIAKVVNIFLQSSALHF
ncbi:MAG: Bax inhibitor-1/YccA family protein, partial [Rhodospirillales bacterium]